MAYDPVGIKSVLKVMLQNFRKFDPGNPLSVRPSASAPPAKPWALFTKRPRDGILFLGLNTFPPITLPMSDCRYGGQDRRGSIGSGKRGMF